MTAKFDEEAFLARARRQLDESASAVDGESASRLSRARHHALSSLEKRASFWPAWGMPAGAISAALAIVLTLGSFQNRSASDNVSDLEELELLSANESFELLEDLEFYEWLPTEQETG